jgi:hypothetical protein
MNERNSAFYCLCTSFSFFLTFFIFSNNNQHKNIFTFYIISIIFYYYSNKKFTTIQIFFTFLYKFFLFYIITSSFYTNSKININPLLCSIHVFVKQDHYYMDHNGSFYDRSPSRFPSHWCNDVKIEDKNNWKKNAIYNFLLLLLF